MSEISVVISGAQDTLSKMRQLTPDLILRADQIISAGALACTTDAKRACPVGTPESTHIKGYHGGRLRASIRPRQIAVMIWDVFTDVYYALFIELGTRKLRARPYLYPAWEKRASQVQQKLQKVFNF